MENLKIVIRIFLNLIILGFKIIPSLTLIWNYYECNDKKDKWNLKVFHQKEDNSRNIENYFMKFMLRNMKSIKKNFHIGSAILRLSKVKKKVKFWKLAKY